MIGIDTNILIRFVTQDDEEQSRSVKKFFKKFEGKKHSIFVNNIVICEFIWVLKRGYKYRKDLIVNTLRSLINVDECMFENIDILKSAIDLFEQGKSDFSDCLISRINSNIGCKETYSFDQKTTQDNLFQLM